jgi:hypothetical protein
MTALRFANDALAFLLELAALAALAVWGFTAGTSWPLRILLGIGAPALMIVVWGFLLAPTADHRLTMPWLLVVKLVVFGLAAAALAAAGHPRLAVVFGVLVVVNLGLATAWGTM